MMMDHGDCEDVIENPIYVDESHEDLDEESNKTC